MFKIKSCCNKGLHYIVDQRGDYLHSDGGILQTPEYWPTKELAQAVLDKYQPKHVWKHGDIATPCRGGQRVFVMVDGNLRIYDEVGQMRTGPMTVHQWALRFGYEKTGNVFGFGL